MQNSLWDIWNNKVIRTYYNILPFKYSSWSTSFHSVLHLSLSVFSWNILHFGWKFLKEANTADHPYRHKTAVSAEDIRRMHRKAHVVLTAISCHKQTGRQCLPLRSCEQTGWCVFELSESTSLHLLESGWVGLLMAQGPHASPELFCTVSQTSDKLVQGNMSGQNTTSINSCFLWKKTLGSYWFIADCKGVVHSYSYFKWSVKSANSSHRFIKWHALLSL